MFKFLQIICKLYAGFTKVSQTLIFSVFSRVCYEWQSPLNDQACNHTTADLCMVMPTKLHKRPGLQNRKCKMATKRKNFLEAEVDVILTIYYLAVYPSSQHWKMPERNHSTGKSQNIERNYRGEFGAINSE